MPAWETPVALLLALSPTGVAWVAGLFGLLVGSFLNVVVHRLPRMMQAAMEQEAREILHPASAPEAGPLGIQPSFNLITPRSHCPACKAPILARHNVPLLSWLWLGGRCAACQAPVSVRYPVVELLTGLLFAIVAWKFGVTPETALALLVTALLIALAVIDFDTQYLPDTLTLPLLWLGLLAAVLLGRGAAPLPVAPAEAIVGAVVGYLSLWSVYWAFRLITGREGMGYGDFKLLAALGAWLGWTAIPLIILLSAVVGALVGGGLILFRGRDHQLPMPFGPFLAAAGWVALLWGPGLVDWYRGLSGL